MKLAFGRHFAFIQLVTLLACWHVLAVECDGKTVRLNPQSKWFDVLSGPSLDPGDVIELEAGVYSDSRRLVISQRGQHGQPIVVRAAPGARVVFQRPDAKQNTINLEGCQYFVLRGIEITGGAAGIRIGAKGEWPAKFIALETLHIHHIGGVAVTANHAGETYQGLRFRGNHIHHTAGHGEGFYLGSNNAKDGSTQGYIFDSLIEGNYIHDLRGPDVSQGDGIEIKDGSYNNIIRDNVIHDTQFPGITVYGTDGKAPNLIERNVIWNSGDNGIQAAAEAVVRNNVIFDVAGDGIHCRNHQSAVVGNLQLLHNTIRNRSSIRISPPKTLSGPIVVAGNAVSGTLRIPQRADIMLEGNVTDVTDLFPSPGSPVIGAAAAKFVPETDFNNTPRESTRDAGAYRFDPAGNPGWKIQPGFKR
jgi:hypothetical protein